MDKKLSQGMLNLIAEQAAKFAPDYQTDRNHATGFVSF